MNIKKLVGFLNTLLHKMHILPLITAIRALYVLESQYGHYVSSFLWSAVDKDRKPIPWFTYPAIEYLKQIDFSDKNIFEWGSGNSTLFWATRSKRVFSVENDINWYKSGLQKTKKLNRVKLMWASNKDTYVNSIASSKKKYDVIVIDGSNRFDCAKVSVKKLKAGGIIVLDNSNWFPEACNLLRQTGLIEIPLVGFAPIIPYTSVTSIFLSRKYSFKKISSKSIRPPGSVNQLLG